jgi:YVTN family beta-propeller protein
VTNSSSNPVSVINLTTNTVVATIPIVPLPENVPTPFGIAITPDGTQAYMANQTNFDGQDVISVINTATNTLDNTILAGAALPSGVAITPDGTRAYVTIGNYGVSVIDIATNTVAASITVGEIPSGIAITPDGTRAYVANLYGSSVSVIDTATNTVVATISDTPAPFGVAITPDGTQAYVTHLFQENSLVSVINTASNSVVTDIFVGTDVNPAGIAITPGIGPPTNKNQCKSGGWQTFTIPEKFKNQGDCVSFVETGK